MERVVFDNEKFISLVEPNPCLWDTANPDYFDRNKKQQCWRQIAEKMCGNFGEMTAVQQNEYGKDLQKKWKNLRNSYARELSKRKKKKKGDATTWKTYVFFDQLSFLMRCSANKETTSNFTEENQEKEEAPVVEEDNDVPLINTTPTRKKKKKSLKQDGHSQTVQLLKASLYQRQRNKYLLDNDEDRHFLLSLLTDFKRVPVDKKIDVKLAMIQSIKSAILPSHPAVTSCSSYYSNTQHLTIHPSAATPCPPQSFPIHPPPSSTELFLTHPLSSTSFNTSQFSSTLQHDIKNIDVTPIHSPYSIETAATSTDGSVVDFLTDYQGQTQNSESNE